MTARNSKSDNERGAVLLTTLLIMTLMAALAVALIEDIRFAVKRAASTQAYAQADWYAVSAEDFAVSYLGAEFANLTPVEINAKLNENAPFILPIDGGSLTLDVRDGSQCFSLSRLVDAPARQEFEDLLIETGMNSFEAKRLSFAAADWMDEDSQLSQNGAEDFTYLVADPAYRTANAPFTSVMEMRSLKGMSEDIYQSIRPFICARPEGETGAINVNTLNEAQLPLLTAALGGGRENATLAETLLSSRPPDGYQSAADIAAVFGEAGELPEGLSTETLGFVPSHIWVEADIRYRNARRVVSMEFAVNETEITRISRYIGAEARRPRPVIKNPFEP